MTDLGDKSASLQFSVFVHDSTVSVLLTDKTGASRPP